LDDTATTVDVRGIPNVVGGIFYLWGLIDGGSLPKNGAAASGIDYAFDNSRMLAVPSLRAGGVPMTSSAPFFVHVNFYT